MGYSQKKLKYWGGILAEYASSGLKPAEFCRRNHLAVKSFYKWRIRLSGELPEDRRSDVSGLELAPVIPPPVPSVSGLPCHQGKDSGISVETGGMTLRLSTGFDAATFRRVLELTGGLPC